MYSVIHILDKCVAVNIVIIKYQYINQLLCALAYEFQKLISILDPF